MFIILAKPCFGEKNIIFLSYNFTKINKSNFIDESRMTSIVCALPETVAVQGKYRKFSKKRL